MRCDYLLFFFGLLLCCCLPGASILAQQAPFFSLYRENQGLLNPASVNPDFLLYHNNYRLSVGGAHRSQWVGQAGKITTQVLRGEFIGVGENSFAPLAGLYLVNDVVGPTSMMGVSGRLASIFGLEHPNFGGFSIGLNAGAMRFRIKASEIDLLDPDDLLGQTDQSQWYPDVGLGFFYYNGLEKNGVETALVYGGFSVAQLFQPELTFASAHGTFPLTRIPHFYATAGLYKFLDAFSFLEVSTWFRYVRHVPPILDINVRYQRNQQYWVGTGLSSAGDLHAEFGVYLHQLIGSDTPPYNRSVLKLSAGFDYAVIKFHEQIDRSLEVNLSVLPKWDR